MKNTIMALLALFILPCINAYSVDTEITNNTLYQEQSKLCWPYWCWYVVHDG